MKIATQKANVCRITAVTIVLSLAMSGLALAPQSASAFWWPWGNYHAHAQGSNNNGAGDANDDEDEEADDENNGSDVSHTITIHKYIDGEPATSETADGNEFPMIATWVDSEGAGEGSAEFHLSSESSPAFQAISTELAAGAEYGVSEVLDGDVVASTCENGHPFVLAGYSTGTDVVAAAAATTTSDAPLFADLSADQHVIVWNETCDVNDDEDDDNTATSSGSISGEVTGGTSEESPGELTVTSVDAEKTTAIANGEFADGWQYVFNITVPEDEPNLAMKFADWMQTDGEHTIPVAGNMRISSAQAENATSTVTIGAADTYSSPELNIVGDLNEEEAGMQVQVLVEVAVPENTYNGTYSTEFGVQTLP